jgi:KipI family sensor histidine kinase inhibitor
VTPPPPRLLPLGDAAFSLVLGPSVDAATEARVVALGRAIAAARLPGVIETVPAYTTLTVHYDPLVIDAATLRDGLRSLLAGPLETDAGSVGRLVEVPVRYDGPDLGEVAAAVGISTDEVIARHLAREYRVVLLGFVPGFAYLAELDPTLVLPRRPAPRTRVPAGSVAIAGAQTGIYPSATPGGWHLIGSTPAELFVPDRDPPNLLAVGDRVRFVRAAG